MEISVDDEEFKLIVEHRKKKAKTVSSIEGRFTKQTLESMVMHARSTFTDYIYLKPGSDPNLHNVGFHVTANGLAYGYTEQIPVSAVKECLRKLNM